MYIKKILMKKNFFIIGVGIFSLLIVIGSMYFLNVKRNENPTLSLIIDKEWYALNACPSNDVYLTITKNHEIHFYHEAAGNPYNNFDLCEKWLNFNDETNEFIFDSNYCKLQYIDYDGKILKMKVDDEVIHFEESGR